LKSLLMAWAGAHLHSLEVLEMSTSFVLPNSLWYGKLYFLRLWMKFGLYIHTRWTYTAKGYKEYLDSNPQ
jgi:hypothetical protein